MRSFDNHRKQMDRSRKLMGRIALAWGVFVLLCGAAIIATVIYGALHPEIIGEFFGRIAAGFDAAKA